MNYVIYIIAGLLGVWIGRRLAIKRKMKQRNFENQNAVEKEKLKK